jgi:hypothetical protein
MGQPRRPAEKKSRRRNIDYVCEDRGKDGKLRGQTDAIRCVLTPFSGNQIITPKRK